MGLHACTRNKFWMRVKSHLFKRLTGPGLGYPSPSMTGSWLHKCKASALLCMWICSLLHFCIYLFLCIIVCASVCQGSHGSRSSPSTLRVPGIQPGLHRHPLTQWPCILFDNLVFFKFANCCIFVFPNCLLLASPHLSLNTHIFFLVIYLGVHC